MTIVIVTGIVKVVALTSAELSEIIADLRRRRGDTTTVEAKAAALGCPELAPTLCAFANMPDGGLILLGLDEGDSFAAIGLDDIATLEQGVASQARTGVIPPVTCEFTTHRVDGADVLACKVAGLPLEDRPARTGGRAYLRQSDGDYPMSEQEIVQIELLKSQSFRRTHPDRQPVPGTSEADLDPDLLAQFVTTVKSSSPRNASASDDEVLRRTGILTADGEVTVAGLYALGTYPQQFLPSLSITAAVQLPSGEGPRTRDLVHLDGPLPELLDAAMNWVRRNTRTTMGYDDRGHGIDTTELPMIAVREIVANALVHRNLDPVTDTKRVELRLLDDQLVITSPGGLWGVSEQQLGQPGGKSAVNPVLYDACTHIRMRDGNRLIEGEGGGIREALLRIRSAGLRPPRFIDAGVRFTAIISRHTLLDDTDLRWLSELSVAVGLSSEQRAILVEMRNGVEWTNAQVRELFAPMDSVEARRLLQDLVDRGLAVMTGTRGTASYSLARTLVSEDRGSTVASETDRGESSTVEKRQADILEALSSPKTFRELTGALSGSEKQIRYALRMLRDAGLVHFDGTRGSRTGTYSLTEVGSSQ